VYCLESFFFCSTNTLSSLKFRLISEKSVLEVKQVEVILLRQVKMFFSVFNCVSPYLDLDINPMLFS
jgi:hypothetical protein